MSIEEVKFVQVLYSPKGQLTALDEAGSVWIFHESADFAHRSFWKKIPAQREETDDS